MLPAINIALVAGLLVLAYGVAWADPPGRIVRLGYMSGQVSFLPAGATDWVQADLNRPLWTGDQIWTGDDARAELQMGNAVMRLAPGTNVSVTAFDDKTEQFQVTQGSVNLRVRSMDADDAVELDTPNLAYSIREPGDYRVDVDASTTTVGVYRGQAEAFGTQNAYMIAAGTRVQFSGTDLGDYQPVALTRADAFDTWVDQRAARYEQSVTARYVAPDVIGYQDLDTYGSWQQVPNYGSVWVPTSVAPDWAPYRYGHWVWLDPWGWTWVDNEPWGFAPFHYGRWAFLESRWAWVPGPRTERAVYAPALVGFVGAPNLGVSVSVGTGADVAWFPLGPGEVYRPAYTASREYFTRVNVTNTVVNVTQVTNVYNNPGRNDVRYANVERPNAVTAVPTQAFVEARPVQRAAVKVNTAALQNAPVLPAPARVAPERQSIIGSAPPAQARPAPAVVERTVVARRAPPPPPPPIEQRQAALKREAGKPLDPAELQKLAPAQARPNVKVVQPSVTPKPLPAVAAATPEKGKGPSEKEAPPATARAQNGPPNANEPSNAKAPPNAKAPEPVRSNTQQPAQGQPPPVAEKQSPVPPSAAETQQRQTARTRPEATPRPTPEQRNGEPLKRPGPPEAPTTAQTPRVPATAQAQQPAQTANAPVQAAPRPTPPGQREREPQQRPTPPTAQAPRAQPQQQPERAPETSQAPRAQPPQRPTPETAQAPRARPQQPERAPETAQEPRAQAQQRPSAQTAQAPRAQPPQPERTPQTAQAPRPQPQPQRPSQAEQPPRAQPQAPRETPEQARQQAALAQQQQREQAAQRAQPAPQQRAPQPKGKGEEEKDKKEDGGK